MATVTAGLRAAPSAGLRHPRASTSRPGRVAVRASRMTVVEPDLAPTGLARRSVVLRVTAVLLAVVGVFTVVVAHVVIDQQQLRIDSMQAAVQVAQARQTTLQYRLAQLEAPQRIIGSAESLGMFPPSAVTYLAPVPESTPLPVPAGVPSANPTPTGVTAQRTAPASSSPTTSPTTSPPGSAGKRAPPR